MMNIAAQYLSNHKFSPAHTTVIWVVEFPKEGFKIRFLAKHQYAQMKLSCHKLGTYHLEQSKDVKSPIFQWLFDGIKAFP